MRRRTTMVLGIAAVVLLLGAATVISRVLEAQMSSGAVYARYSSLRSDPEGSKLLYESLAAAGARVSRYYRDTDALSCSGAAVLFAGVAPASLQVTAADFERLARGGCRVVVAVSVPEDMKGRVTVGKWDAVLVRANNDSCLEYGREWRNLHPRGNCILAAERAVGRGTLVLVSDAAVFANSSVARRRDTAVLAAIIGPAPRVIVDEFHHGVHEAGSIVGLGRRYRLHGLGAGLLVVTILFLWRRSRPFPLPDAEPAVLVRADAAIEGRSAFAGLVNLLERNVPAADVPGLVWDRWKRTASRRKAAAIASQVQALPDAEPPLALYADIQKLVSPSSTRP
jgi:hypothetical protein